MPRYKVTLEFGVEVDPVSDAALIAEEGSEKTAAVQIAEEYLHSDGTMYAHRVTELSSRADEEA
jgi:hypothetical protein